MITLYQDCNYSFLWNEIIWEKRKKWNRLNSVWHVISWNLDNNRVWLGIKPWRLTVKIEGLHSNNRAISYAPSVSISLTVVQFQFSWYRARFLLCFTKYNKTRVHIIFWPAMSNSFKTIRSIRASTRCLMRCSLNPMSAYTHIRTHRHDKVIVRGWKSSFHDVFHSKWTCEQRRWKCWIDLFSLRICNKTLNPSSPMNPPNLT